MHSFCQFCIFQWKNTVQEQNQQRILPDCPICRTAVTFEKRNFVFDSAIDAIVAFSSEEMKDVRRTLVEERLALANQVSRPSGANTMPPPPGLTSWGQIVMVECSQKFSSLH